PAVVAELLARLDGHPLAIELAATRARALSSADLLRKLDDRFALLRSDGVWDARHRALGSVIESSWDALAAPERQALAQLTVFGGTFSSGAAEITLALAPGSPPALEVIEALRGRY